MSDELTFRPLHLFCVCARASAAAGVTSHGDTRALWRGQRAGAVGGAPRSCTNPGNARSRCPPSQTAGIRCGHARPCPGGLSTGVPGQEGGAARAGSARSGGQAVARMSEHSSGPQRHRQSVTFISNTRSLVTGTFSPILGCLASLAAARITAITTAESRRGCMHMSLDPMTALWLEMNRRAEHKRQFPASGDPSPRRAVRQSRTSRNR